MGPSSHVACTFHTPSWPPPTIQRSTKLVYRWRRSHFHCAHTPTSTQKNQGKVSSTSTTSRRRWGEGRREAAARLMGRRSTQASVARPPTSPRKTRFPSLSSPTYRLATPLVASYFPSGGGRSILTAVIAALLVYWCARHA